MSAIIDISTPLGADIVAWPGSPGVTTERFLALSRGDVANASTLAMDVHCGTHLDAPLHVLPEAGGMSSIALDVLLGEALVVELGDARTITAADLEPLVAPSTRRLLLKTVNSRGGVSEDAFDEDFAALTPSGAEWVVRNGIELIGIDYLSIQRFADDQTTHEVLLGAGVVILEGLRLAHVAPGSYDLLCLPLALPDLEAAPARAVLRRLEST